MQRYTSAYLISFLLMIVTAGAIYQDEKTGALPYYRRNYPMFIVDGGALRVFKTKTQTRGRGSTKLICGYNVDNLIVWQENQITEDWRPTYHFVPPSGWMNDPNGLIWFDGYYHMFFQHNPYAPVARAGNMSWGHARSKDLLEWEHLPVALSPSLPEDSRGCFSGCAVNVNGTLKLIYTGNSPSGQVQCIASSEDTINFTKYGKVLSSPVNASHFRDPKVWHENGSWYMIVSSFQNRRGQHLLFESSNLRQWSYVAVLADDGEYFDREWECPDFFELSNKHVLITSMLDFDRPTRGCQNRNYARSAYVVGQWKSASRTFSTTKHNFKQIDHGHDFYAPQTWQAPDGRRIMIAWFGSTNYLTPEAKYNWAGMMTIPRELSLSNRGTVSMVPMRELEKLRRDPPLEYRQRILNGEYLKLCDGVPAVEVSMTWNLSNSRAEKYGLRLGDEEYADGGLYLYVDTQSERLTLDRRYSKYKISGYRSIPLPDDKLLLSLRVYFDKSSVEVFVNDGETSMSSRIYSTNNQRFLSLFAENGSAKLELCRLWELKRTLS